MGSVRFSLARLMGGFTVAAVGIGITAAERPHNDFAIMACFAIIGTGICLPFMRAAYAVPTGLLLSIVAFIALLAWLIAHATPPDPNF